MPSKKSNQQDETGAARAPMPPGVPVVQPAALEEPTEPVGPLPPKQDQGAPATVSPTGAPTGNPSSVNSQQGDRLTTSQGARLPDTDHSLKAGPRGPVLLRDHHLREKINHFDHERIPERVVHARGAAAHGTFVANGAAEGVCRAAFLSKDVQTPVFVRFSTVLGSRGSADSVRDTRGFATKFYTGEGTFDLVGNNIPVFFIQDAIKFPDIIHAGKPHPDRELPQAQSAHDSFWDFVSLHTEAQHHTMWNMSDRGIPRSYRMMQGFGVHTFRVEDAQGATSLVKWHWKPLAGVHSLVWEEAQLIAGTDPDFHRRDLADNIEAGNFPQWELGIQVFEDNEEQTFAGIDLLDPTKIVPEELAPVQPIGLLTLNANPTNYFAETEQVAYNVGNLVPGIDVTDDALMAGRLFSYIDTQMTRLGGPNFGQLPVNRPHAPVNDMQRDGMHQQADHGGVAPYHPNSLDGGCPFMASAEDGGYVEVPVAVPAAPRGRQAPQSFADHTSQPRQFFQSLTEVEQAHVIEAYTFELSKCFEHAVRERQLQALARIDADLTAAVAAGLGLPVPASPDDLPDMEPSPALSQVGGLWPWTGRQVAVVVGPESDVDDALALANALDDAGLVPLVVADHGGVLTAAGGVEVPVNRSLASTRSTEFDAIVLADGRGPHPKVGLMLDEAFRHGKPLLAWGSGVELLPGSEGEQEPGVVRVESPGQVVDELTPLLAAHRVWERLAAAG